MDIENIEWDKNLLFVSNEVKLNEAIEEEQRGAIRQEIEPWLSALFQSKHFSLLVGSGLTTGLANIANVESQGMGRLEFEGSYKDKVDEYAEKTAERFGRGEPNFEDDLRTALELLRGLEIQKEDSTDLEKQIDTQLESLVKNILSTERDFLNNLKENKTAATKALTNLKSFLLSFSSRSSSRNRLNLFTTNYDRFLEYGLDSAGILYLDRFIGSLNPKFRETKLNYDYHYNPPGIRGEPRYVEGVVKYSKLHGSIDWKYEADSVFKRLLPFGASDTHPEIVENLSSSLLIYPNSSKGIETSFYPYSELFREFSTAICRPNSSLVTYGYGFGDSHINSVIEDMLSIPSTHLVIISYNDAKGRIKSFFEDKNPSQFTLLIGDELGSLDKLNKYYLPKSAIDRISIKKASLLKNRGEAPSEEKKNGKVDINLREEE